MQPTALSMRERMRLDALFVRVRKGDHYEVLGVRHDAPEGEILVEYEKLQSFLRELLNPQRELGEHGARVEAVAHAIENAWRILGNRHERLRYDAQAAPDALESRPPHAGSASRLKRDATLPAHLLAALEAALGLLLRRDLDLRAFAGGALNLRDPAPAQAAAERCERDEKWFDAAVWWHLAALADPTNAALFLRAASAMRRGGVSAAFERYQKALERSDIFDEGM